MNHGLETKSPARHCHLCREMTGSGIVAICRHFADHLEDIAIAASPMDIDSDDDSDAGSMKSHGHLAEEKDKLQTIAEDEEEITYTEWEAETTKVTSGATPKLTAKVSSRTDDILAPNCAICNAPAYPECPCESERLQLAVKQAQQRAMNERLGEIRKVSLYMLKHRSNFSQRLGNQPCTGPYIECFRESDQYTQTGALRLSIGTPKLRYLHAIQWAASHKPLIRGNSPISDSRSSLRA
jgi:hypothetical protein